jgi:hypothetical protein
MSDLTLLRINTSDQGTLGRVIGNSVSCYSLELPWRDNQVGKSCIPVGEYEVQAYRSKRYRNSFKVLGVPDRSAILIHAGNVAGDRAMGYLSNSQGCILLGLKHGFLHGQKAVLMSQIAIDGLAARFPGGPFTLEIKEAY